MPIVIAFVLALTSVPLGRGRLGRLAEIHLRRWWLLAGAFAVQLGALRLPEGGSARALHLASYALGALYLASNLHLPGLWWVGLGGAMNLVAIAANAGVMPASADALQVVGGDSPERFSNSAALADARLAFLGDILPVPLPWGLANVVSLGDLVIVAGIFLAVHRICGSRLVPAATGMAAGLAVRPRVRTVAVAHGLAWAGAWLFAGAVVLVTLGRPGALASAVAMGLSGVCAALMLGGPLTDRFNRPALLACVTFAQACAAALLLIWPSPAVVGTAAVIVGFASGLAQPATFALMAGVVEPERRTPALAGLAALSASVSLVLAGFPMSTVRGGGPRPVLAAAALACGLAALAWSITPAQRRPPPRRATLWRDLLLAVRALEDTPPLARLALLSVALGGGVGLAAIDPFIALGLAWRRATPLGLSAGALGAGVLVGALACAGIRRPATLLGPALAVAGGGLFLAAAGGEVPWALLAWFVGGAGVGGAGVLVMSATLGLAPSPLGGRLLALVLAGQLVGLGTGYTLGGSLQRSGGPVASGAAAGIALFAGVVLAGRLRISVPEDGVDDADQRPAPGEASEVLAEQGQKSVVRLPHGRVGDVGSDEAVVESPEGVPVGEGFGVGDIESGAAELSGPESLDQVIGDHMGAAGDIDENSSWAESVQLLPPDDVDRLRRERQGDEGHEGPPQSLAQSTAVDGPCRTCQWLGLSAHDCCLHAEGGELVEQGSGDASGTEDGHLGSEERAGSVGR